MTRELNLPCQYKVVYNSYTNSYRFNTDSLAEYEVFFSKADSLFDFTDFAKSDVYHIAINKTRSGLGGRDPQIQITITAIVEHFFKDRDRMLAYVYDSNDGKELIRKRLFKIWEKNENHTEIIKMDSIIKTEDMTYHTGIIFHRMNFLGIEAITKGFNEIVKQLTEK